MVSTTPAAFNPGKETQYPLYKRLGGPRDRSGWERKISPPPGFDPRPVQSVASRYTELSRPTKKSVRSNEFRVTQHRTPRSLGSSVCLVNGLRYRRHWTRGLIAGTSKTDLYATIPALGPILSLTKRANGALST